MRGARRPPRGAGRAQRITQAGEVNAPSEVAERLGGAAGEPVVVRRRVMYMDGVPTELTDTYYPLGEARGTPLAGAQKIPWGRGHTAR